MELQTCTHSNAHVNASPFITGLRLKSV